MRRFWLGMTVALVAQWASATSGIWGSFIQITANGGTAQWYDAGYSSALPDFQGANLGTFDPGAGNTLVISGGEVDTFKNGADDVFGANMQWRVWSGSPSGSFTSNNLGFTANLPFNNAAGVAAGTAGDQKWAQIASTPNVLTGLAPGTYTLDVYFTAPFNFGTHFDNNGANNYRATFTVVPEPGTLVLAGAGLAGLGLARLRRRA